ncbi:MAG TPA: twin-arginine translocation signal domain-containing protein [Candidatus Acidoferrum sp.]|nr:twin-arginine translocation signal domain-containing protein [Candidatus Acidoferrum sp.]
MKASSPALNRRGFLKTAALAALAASSPALLRAQDKAGTRNPIIGSGAHTYECIHDWGELPANIIYGNTHGVCQDAQGRIYIKHTVGAGSQCADAIVVFDENGAFVRSWGAEFKGGAHGLHINREGKEEFLYLADPQRHLMKKTTLEGKELFTLTVPLESGLYNSAEEYHPTNVATAPNGDFYIADGYGKSWLHQYDSEAKYIRSFGGPGNERGQTRCSHGLMVDTRGSAPVLVVADRSNRRLQYFTLDGRHICFVTNEMRAPCHFHQKDGDLVVPDLESRVTILDRNNKLIVHLGDGGHYRDLRTKPRSAFTPGKFVAPHSAYYDHDGNIFVVEWVEVGRVTKLRRLA